jgi:hypothetical protein
MLSDFVSTSSRATEPLARALTMRASALVGGEDALFITDDTASVKKRRHSAGVEHHTNLRSNVCETVSRATCCSKHRNHEGREDDNNARQRRKPLLNGFLFALRSLRNVIPS